MKFKNTLISLQLLPSLLFCNGCFQKGTDSSSTENRTKEIVELRNGLITILNTNNFDEIDSFLANNFILYRQSNVTSLELSKIDNFNFENNLFNYSFDTKKDMYNETFSLKSDDDTYDFYICYTIYTKSIKLNTCYIIDKKLINDGDKYQGDGTELCGFYINRIPTKYYLNDLFNLIENKDKESLVRLFLKYEEIDELSSKINKLLEINLNFNDYCFYLPKYYQTTDKSSNVLENGYYFSISLNNQENNSFYYIFIKYTTYFDSQFITNSLRNITVLKENSNVYENGYWLDEEIADDVVFVNFENQ